MKQSGAKWLFVVCCLLAAGALVQDFRFDASARQARTAALRVERDIGSLRATLAELRGGQTAYLATGQGPDFWMRRVTDLATQMESGLGGLRGLVGSPEAQSQVSAAETALADLLSIDKRARQAIETEQRFLASDVIFAEGLNTTQVLADALLTVAVAENAALDAQIVRDARIRLALTTAALLLVIVAGLTLAQAQRQPASPASAAATMAQMLRELPPPVRAAPLPSASTPISAVRQPLSAVSPGSAADLTEAAELCVDLARVLDAKDIPALLGRAAGVLDATGVVVWVVNRQGDTLAPVLSHGYSDRVISKLGRLDVAADNITSVCFRTMRPQTMPGVGQPGTTSAIAVPLVTAEGCNGVIAAELQAARPADQCVAIARIIAAQFATMISPTESSGEAARAAEA
jgi:hypothetical protein